MTNRIAHITLLAALLGAGLALAGCDSSEIDESDYAVFEGTWSIESLSYRDDEDNSFIDITALLYAEYSDALFFFADNDTEGRQFELSLNRDGGADREIIGDVQINGESDTLVLFTGGDASAEVVFDYVFDASVRITLRAKNVYGGYLLDLLFGPDNAFGEFVEVRMILTKNSD